MLFDDRLHLMSKKSVSVSLLAIASGRTLCKLSDRSIVRLIYLLMSFGRVAG
jgi:hypothetical protein